MTRPPETTASNSTAPDTRSPESTAPESAPSTSMNVSSSPPPLLRIGLGLDRHRFVDGRPLRLGGIEIPHSQGLLGHSDADALLHAICDALLGAAGLDDIGTLFPDTDPEYAGADSRDLARHVVRRVTAAGYTIASIDSVLVADAPKIAPHRAAIRKSLATLFLLPSDAVNVKAKTTEGAGPDGVVDVTAVALLSKATPLK